MAIYLIDPGQTLWRRSQTFPALINLRSPQARNLQLWLPLTAPNLWQIGKPQPVSGQGTQVSAPPLFGDPTFGLVPQFDGTADAASVAMDLSGYAQITVSFWLYWNAFANDDDLCAEYSASWDGASAFIIDPNQSTSGAFFVGLSATSNKWSDTFTRPSAGAWHHYVWGVDRTTPANTVWVDGVSQTLSTFTHTAATYGNFSNSTLYLMSRATTSLFGAGKISDLRIYSGLPNTAMARALYDPATRWDLYAQPARRVMVNIASASAPKRLMTLGVG